MGGFRSVIQNFPCLAQYFILESSRVWQVAIYFFVRKAREPMTAASQAPARLQRRLPSK